MRHMLAGENIGLIAVVQSQAANLDYFDCIFVSNKISDVNMFRRGGPTLFALYTYPNSTDQIAGSKRTPNLNKVIIEKIINGLGLSFTTEKTDAPNTFAPIDLLDYIYAVLHSPSYREKYQEFLKVDFPRVPYPKDQALFWQLVKIGGELRQTHLLENSPTQSTVSYPVAGEHLVDKPKFEDGKVYINKTQYFDNVPELAWHFYIGGYQPAQKWLKDRKGRALSLEGIQHYQKIIFALTETDRLMQAVDEVFES